MASVTIYTKATCGYCFRAKKMLEMKHVDFEEIAIDGDMARRAEMIQRANGRSTVPQIFIEGRHIGGCDDLFELEMDGKLDGLLKAA